MVPRRSPATYAVETYVKRSRRGQARAKSSICRVPSTLMRRDSSSERSNATDAAPWTIAPTRSASGAQRSPSPRCGIVRSPASAVTRPSCAPASPHELSSVARTRAAACSSSSARTSATTWRSLRSRKRASTSMPTKPVAPVSRRAPSGTGGKGGWGKGIGTPAVECERPGCWPGGAGAMAWWRTFITANPTRGPGDTTTLPARRRGARTAGRRDSEVVQRVRDRAVDPHLEVQVRPEAQAGAAAVADDLALADGRPERRREARLVRVARRERRGVRDARVVAVAARRADGLHQRHLARRGGTDGRPARHADVDAGVARLPRAALAERRGDRPVDRPDHAAVALPDRARGQRSGRLLQRCLD